ncbi:MAG TPA: IS3 family transposase [Clostridiales bacterium]|nr:IS3 family transposase [Clostridiales bacterium]
MFELQYHEITISRRYNEIERFINYYNNKRTKQKLGYFSPVEYMLKYQAA